MTATKRINIRTTPHVKAVIVEASQLMGVSMSDFVIQASYAKAIKILKDVEQMEAITATSTHQAVRLKRTSTNTGI